MMPNRVPPPVAGFLPPHRLHRLVLALAVALVGAILGAVSVTLLPELLRGVGNAYLLVFGILVLAILIVLPRGLISLIDPATYRRRAKRGNRPGVVHGGSLS